jgi:outer membrane immunogenic protein
MKQFFQVLGIASLAAVSSGAAFAADMAVKAAPLAVQRCAADQFKGGYVGVNGGAVNWTSNRTDQDERLIDAATYVQKGWAGMVGGQVGYNGGSCNTIWGFEIDGDWVSGRNNTQLIPNNGQPTLFNINVASRWDAIVTARGRAGVVLDNMLLYVTGGVAAGHFKTAYTNQFFGIPGVVAGNVNTWNTDQWRYGLVAGVGAEWAFGGNWTVRSEVLYVDFIESSHNVLSVSVPGPGFLGGFRESDSAWIGRIGVNYRFGGGAVVARY